jgi:carboxylesterase
MNHERTSMQFDVNPLALPFEFQGHVYKDISCLLIHSFTASPSEVRALGIFLRNNGYSGLAPLLPGHGSHPNELKQVTWLDWYESVRESLLYLRRNYENVIIIGVSLGAVLATMLAASPERENVAGLVLITPSQHQPSSLIINILPFIKRFKKEFTTDSDEQIAYDLQEHANFYYSKRPTSALIELYRVIGFTNKRLPLISQPTLIIHSKKDQSSTLDSPDFIYNLVKSTNKQIFHIEHSGRGFLLADEALPAFEKIHEFIQSIKPKTT